MKGRDIRKMPWPARIRYLWDYYKVPIFTAAILLYILFYILWRFATRQDQVLFAAAVNAPISQETLDLMEAFPASSYGPGEGKEADIGVACGKGDGLLFRKGQILHKVPRDQIVPALIAMAQEL